MTDIVKSACKALGVNYAASAPRCELYKLLLYETGSQYVQKYKYSSYNDNCNHLANYSFLPHVECVPSNLCHILTECAPYTF